MKDQLDVEIFRAGQYGPKGTWGEAELEQMAADYDPALHEAPVTLDHAQQGPALGWVQAVRRFGDRLVARLRGLNTRLLELIHQGAFKKRSIELYPRLRETGRPYLRAVSFLGASVPEVKGLSDPLISTGASAPLFADDEAEPIEIDYVEEPAPEETDQPRTAPVFQELADRLQGAGQWHPSWGERGIEQFYEALATIGEIELGEGQKVDAAQWFGAFLEELPPIIMMGEAAPAPAVTRMEETIPQGAPVAPASITLHRSVQAYRQAHPGIGYAEALGRCAATGGD